MRQFSVLILIFALHIAAAPFLHAESSDPSELFLSAYMSVQNGEKLEEQGKYKLALQKYRYAASLLEQIHDKSPQWQPLIVDYRTKKTTESIDKIQKKIDLEGPGNTHEEPDTTLPQKSDDTAPSVSVTPNVTTPDAGTSTSGGSGDVFENATKAMRDKFERMQAELNDTKQKYLDVQRQNVDLADKLQATIDKLDKSRVNETQLKSQLSQAEEAYKNAVADKTKDTEGQKDLKDEVTRLQNAVKDAQAERDVEEETNEDLTQKIKGVKTERDVAVKQRDEAVDSLNKAKDAQQQVDKLMAENTALVQKLNDAEKTIAQFNSDAPTKDAAIASLKKEVGDTKDQLAAALKQSQENQNSMNDLQSQLESATTELSQIKAGTVPPDDKKKLTDENELLRGIVMRERKEEAHRDQEKKLVLAELEKLHVQSDALVDKINYLGQPVVKLTEQERSLFKQPQIAISDQDISIAVQKPEASPSPSPVPAASSTPSSSASPIPAASPSPTPVVPAPSSSASPTPASSPESPSPSATPEMPAATATPAASQATAATPDAAGSAPHVETSITPPVPAELVPQANEAKEEFERGHYRDAEKTYESMLSKEPKNIYILSNLGVVRFRSGKLKSAEETFRKAIVVAPDDAFSHCTLGIVYYSQGKLDEAVGELTKALAINSKNATAHNYLGITAAAKGWVEAARKELETAIRIDPNYSDA
ncbi:MAG: tetratricopeptide repeat protein, partial [Chthoniobacteraceae bacterium]